MEIDDFASQEFDTESFFDDFVKSVGGELIKKRFNHPPTFNNADYFFQEENVIIELKSLKTDFAFNSPKRKKKLQDLFSDWYKRGKITQKMISNPDLLPPEFNIQALRLFKPPLQSILEKANKQIKGTKKELKLEAAEGIVIIFNDGLYGITPGGTIAVIGDILKNLYPTIEAFVYFTLRKRIEIPNDEHKRIIWMSYYRDSNNIKLNNFVNWLGRSWFDYLERISGVKFLSEIENNDPNKHYIINAKFE